VLGMPLANLFRIGQGFGAMNIIDCSQAGAQLSALNQLPILCPPGAAYQPSGSGRTRSMSSTKS
jgi:hypothetical protein